MCVCVCVSYTFVRLRRSLSYTRIVEHACVHTYALHVYSCIEAMSCFTHR